MRRAHRFRLGVLLALLVLGGGAWWYMSGGVGADLHAAIDESSGLVASRRHPGIFWTHNDSGGEARLFAVRVDGSLVQSVRVRGATNIDWEDITLDATGRLWIADMGNNRSNRSDLTLYAVPEPALEGEESVDVTARIEVHYPEQRGWPDPSRNFDAEALFADGDVLYVLTKHRSDTRTVLYRVPPEGGALERQGEFDVGGDRDNFGGRVTSADLSADGKHLAVLTYHAVFIFERSAGDHWLAKPVREIPLEQRRFRQCEAIAWAGATLIVTNEGGRVFTLPDPMGAP